jgi:hypothetical protein
MTNLEEIQQLDPVRDHQRIVFLNGTQEFPFDSARAMEMALFRTFAVPSISGLLEATGEFIHRAQKRYHDTDLLLSEILENGYDSERGLAALRRMNQMHGRYPIANADYLYVLSTFIYEPIRWIERFGWRPLSENERLATFYFWREVGRRMNIREIPEEYHLYERFNVAYERAHFQYRPANRAVGDATLAVFLAKLPRPLRSLGQSAVLALMDEPLLDAFGYPHPSAGLRRVVSAVLRGRARVAGTLPERRRPVLRTRFKRSTYPKGYQIDDLGPR